MADKFQIDASEVERNEAEAEKFRAERDEALAEARKKGIDAELAELNLRKQKRVEDDELAKNVHHKMYVFDDSVSSASVKKCIDQLTTWSRLDPQCDITIEINSPGGSIVDGFALIDSIRGLRDRGHKVTMVALGYAASMAGVILQAADERVMGKHAFLLIHEGSLGAVGDFGQVEDRLKFMNLLHKKIIDLFVERAAPINKKVTQTFIKKNWQRKDWWLTAEECVRLGFADCVR